jgi:hypothetical protein
MTARLCKAIDLNFSEAVVLEKFFNKSQQSAINQFALSEQTISSNVKSACKTNIYFGFFFDGTKNNYMLAEKNKTLSNIARLYDCYPGLSVPGVLPELTEWKYNPSRYTHFFRTYIPGVASPFTKVNDSGQGVDLQLGQATGYLGQARIVWALLQALNNVHRYFLKAPLLTPQETTLFMKSVVLNKSRRRQMTTAPGEVTDD